MPLPPADHPCWQKLASGGLSKIRTHHLGTQLMTKRLERSHDPLPIKVAEIHAFFTKWERVLPSEIAQLTQI